MPIDLSQVRGQQIQQDRVDNRSDTILPQRPITQAPAVQVEANIRNGERGTPEVDDLKQTLGIVDQSVGQLVQFSQAKYQQAETQNAQLAAQANVTGQVDQDLMAKSQAYREVIANGRAVKTGTELEATAMQRVQQALDASQNNDPTKGEKPFTLQDANQIVEDTFRQGVLDKDGQPIDFGDPSANVRLYKFMAQAREHIVGQAAMVIQKQEQTKAIGAIADDVQTGFLNKDPEALEKGMAQVKKLGLDPSAALDVFQRSAIDAALRSKSVDPITAALASTKADGSPSFNQEQQGALLQAQHTLTTQFEAEHRQEQERVSMSTMGQWAIDVASGKLRLTPDMVKAAVANGTLAPQYAQAALNVQQTQDERAHQRIEWQHQAVMYGLESSRARLELQNARDEQTAKGILAAGLRSGQTGSQIAASLFSNSGRFSGGTSSGAFLDALKMSQALPSNEGVIKHYSAESHQLQLQTFFQAVENKRNQNERAARPGVITPDQLRERENDAYTAFVQALIQGRGADRALTVGLTAMGLKPNDPAISYYLSRASSRLHAPLMATSGPNQGQMFPNPE